MKKKFIIILYIIGIIYLIVSNCSIVMAQDIKNIYNVVGDNNGLYNAAKIVLGIIKWAGVVICIIVIMIKGIKFMTVSPEGKAKIKEELVMIVVGAIILFSFVTLIDTVYTLVQNAKLNELTYP